MRKVVFLSITSILIIALIHGCEKFAVEIILKPIIITEVNENACKVEGVFLDKGNRQLIQYGFCYSLSENPTIDDFIIDLEIGSKYSFSTYLDGLSENTIYYVRSFAKNSIREYYSTETVFSTLPVGNAGSFIDSRDNQEYNWIKYNKQFWMTENLNFVSDTGSWNYDNDATKAELYGRLYNWETARLACPIGWHLPGYEEWFNLMIYLEDNGFKYDDSSENEWSYTGDKIGKAMATDYGWNISTNAGAVGNTDYPKKRNASGFSALPGGYRTNINGKFVGAGNNGTRLTSTGTNSGGGRISTIFSNTQYILMDGYPKEGAMSVRCVHD